MSSYTKNEEYSSQAEELGALMKAFSKTDDGALYWQSENPEIVTPDFMVGYAGVAMSLLRLGNPERVNSIYMKQTQG